MGRGNGYTVPRFMITGLFNMSTNRFVQNIRMKFDGFLYNYCWSDFVHYVDGWIPKFALFVPIVGYLLLFNDRISDIFVFNNLTSVDLQSSWLNGVTRLRCIYFGLIFLGVSNFIYKTKKPYIFRFGDNIVGYTKTCLETFTFQDFLNIHNSIRSDGHYTFDGKYPDSDWEMFKRSALNADAGSYGGEGVYQPEVGGNWGSSISKHGSLLKSILREHFIKNDTKKRFWLTVCVALSTVGYILLVIPSLDIFCKVVVSIFDIR